MSVQVYKLKQPLKTSKDKQLNVKIMGKYMKVVQTTATSSTLQNFKRLNKLQYMDKSTGEVLEYIKQSKNKAENLESVKKQVKNIEQVILTNFTGADNEVMITVTYAENMTDTKRLMKDLEKFLKRLRYKLEDDFECVQVVEPQERGAWHSHILVKFKEMTIMDFGPCFINKKGNKEFRQYNDEVIAKCWGHGWTTMQSMSNIRRADHYLAAYLTDIKNGEQTKKGARLPLYPSGMRIMRRSKGIKDAETVQMTWAQLQDLSDGDIKTSSYAVIDLAKLEDDQDIDDLLQSDPQRIAKNAAVLNVITYTECKIKNEYVNISNDDVRLAQAEFAATV